MAYFVGLDLGQSADYTALAVVQTVKERDERGNLKGFLHLRHLERYPLRTPYTTIADGVAAILRSEVLTSDEYDPSRHRIAKPKVELLVDKTGVGRAVTDILKGRGLRFTGIVIHGGESSHHSAAPTTYRRRTSSPPSRFRSIPAGSRSPKASSYGGC